jgi:arylsulfate sulfotransferase
MIAVLTHRTGVLCLDKAFDLIEGHPRTRAFYIMIHGSVINLIDKYFAPVISDYPKLVNQHVKEIPLIRSKIRQETSGVVRLSFVNICRIGFGALLALSLAGCGRGSAGPYGIESGGEAQQSAILISGSQPGVTPFIATVYLVGQSVSDVDSIAFTISPKPNTVSQPVHVTWSMTALVNRGYVQDNSINLPVFGLYSGYQNSVTLDLTFKDESTQQLQYAIATQPYTDPNGVYTSPIINKARAPGTTLGFDFFTLKSELGSPVVVDTDAQVRWVVPGIGNSPSAHYSDGQFLIGSPNSLGVTLIQLDGTTSSLTPGFPAGASSFTHNIDHGKTGLLAEFNGSDSLGDSIGDIVSEVQFLSTDPPLQTFDMATILSTYMQSMGDDPSGFVRPGSDWFHVNASTYDPSDNTIIISSRENFLIKLDYVTQEIVWIFGDPTKYWYTFPSLRAKALTLDPGGLYPVGQHAISITSDGYIMVMNDGLGSQNQPPGEPAGVTRAYSEVSAYSVNAAAMTAHQEWGFDYGQSIFSPLCGSSYEAPGKTYLVDFATAYNYADARLVGLDSNLNVVFDFQYASPSICISGWNATPAAFDNLQISN